MNRFDVYIQEVVSKNLVLASFVHFLTIRLYETIPETIYLKSRDANASTNSQGLLLR